MCKRQQDQRRDSTSEQVLLLFARIVSSNLELWFRNLCWFRSHWFSEQLYMFSGIAFLLSEHNHFSSKQRWMAWLLFWKIFVHYSSPGCECFAEDIVFVPFFSSWKVQSLGSRCWCRVWRFCHRERVMVPYSVQDKGTRLIIELYIPFFSPLSILNDTMWGVNGKNMTAGWENHQPPNPVPQENQQPAFPREGSEKQGLT